VNLQPQLMKSFVNCFKEEEEEEEEGQNDEEMKEIK
jgi:hypothetical protein